jgi:hypothetical protein
MPEPPVAGVHNQVANGPGLLVEEQPLYVTDVAIRRFDVILLDRVAAA